MKKIDSRYLPSVEIISVIDGYAVLDDEWEETNVKSPFSRLYYIKKGTAYITCNNRSFKMTAGNVYLIPAETEFSYKGAHDDMVEKRFFHISIPTLEHFELLSDFGGIYSLSVSEAQAEDVFECYPENNYTYVLEIKSILYKTIVAFFHKYNFPDVLINDYSAIVKKAMEYIHQNLKASLTAKEISDAVFTSESNLRIKFRAESGIPIGRYIDNLLLNNAKNLLIHSDYSIGEISDILGFRDQFYFSKRFKGKTDRTPSQYRCENKLFMY